MKINRLVALAAVALLVVAAMGAVGARTFAQSTSAPAAQSGDCAAGQSGEGIEVEDAGPGADDGEVQCGDQEDVGSMDVNETEPEGGSDGQEAAPAGTPSITADAAQKTAEAHLNAGPAASVELDLENGRLVYSVEFSGGPDVKVDAMTGEVLGVETGQD